MTPAITVISMAIAEGVAFLKTLSLRWRQSRHATSKTSESNAARAPCLCNGFAGAQRMQHPELG
jgi:hypothetical protein